jgi:hypothetical protein
LFHFEFQKNVQLLSSWLAFHSLIFVVFLIVVILSITMTTAICPSVTILSAGLIINRGLTILVVYYSRKEIIHEEHARLRALAEERAAIAEAEKVVEATIGLLFAPFRAIREKEREKEKERVNFNTKECHAEAESAIIAACAEEMENFKDWVEEYKLEKATVEAFKYTQAEWAESVSEAFVFEEKPIRNLVVQYERKQMAYAYA